jgi:hypothetical protein
LYFSAWLSNLYRSDYTAPQEPDIKFELIDVNGNVLDVYYTGQLPRTDMSTGLVWLQYGFNFNNGNHSSVILRIYNNGAGGNGNDFVMDDIEIRLCVPPVALSPSIDSVICAGTPFTILGEYIDDGTFGVDFLYQWQFNNTNQPNAWTDIQGASGAATGSSLSIPYNIASTDLSHTGYYRLVVGNASTMSLPNCRGASAPIHLTVNPLPTFTVQDTSVCGIDLRQLVSGISVGSVVRFYADSFATVGLTSSWRVLDHDTVFYALATDVNTGCKSSVQAIKLQFKGYPSDNPTTGKSVVCIDETVELTNNNLEGGTWRISNPTIAQIIEQTPNSIKLKGLAQGKIFVSYTMGNNCTTIETFPLKITPNTPPKIIIGIER